MNQIISTPKANSGRSVKIILSGVLGTVLLVLCLAAFGALPELLGVRININPIHLVTGALVVFIQTIAAALKSRD